MRTDRDGNQGIVIPDSRPTLPFPGGGFGWPNQGGGIYCGGHRICGPAPSPGQQALNDIMNGISGIYGVCKKALGFGGGGDEDDDSCDVRRDIELNFCRTRFVESALPGATAACRTRTQTRWEICKRNGRTGGNDTMPPAWDEKQEEVWRNFNR